MTRSFDIKILRILLFLLFLSVLLPLSKKIGPITFYTPDIILAPLTFWSFLVFLHRDRIWIHWYPEEKLAVLILVFMTISSILSADPIQSLNTLLVWLRCSIIYFIVRVSLRSKFITFSDAEHSCLFYLMALLAIGSIQLITDSRIGMVANYFGEDHFQGITFDGRFRISGTAFHPNVYGIWIVLLSTVINIHLLYKKTAKYNILLFIILSWELYVILGTLSRGSLLYYVITLLLTSLIWNNINTKSAASRILAPIIIFFLSGSIFMMVVGLSTSYEYLVNRFTFNADNKRIAYLMYGYELLKHYKTILLGTGVGTFFTTLDIEGIGYDKISIWRNLNSSASGIHNIIGMMMVETGIISTMLFLYVAISSLRTSYQMTKKCNFNEQNTIIFILLSAIIIPSQISNAPWSIWILPLITFIIALLYHFKETTYYRY